MQNYTTYSLNECFDPGLASVLTSVGAFFAFWDKRGCYNHLYSHIVLYL